MVFLLSCVSSAAAGQAPAAAVSFPDAWSEMIPDTVPAAATGREETPKVIDRITNPDTDPSFVFDDKEDLLEIWFPYIRDQDCAVFRYQNQVWMLDCGDERAEEEIVPLLRYLEKIIPDGRSVYHASGKFSLPPAAADRGPAGRPDWART